MVYYNISEDVTMLQSEDDVDDIDDIKHIVTINIIFRYVEPLFWSSCSSCHSDLLRHAQLCFRIWRFRDKCVSWHTQDHPMIHLFVHIIDFILLVLWIFARLQKTAPLQKKCSRGFIPFPLSVGFVTVFEFAGFCSFMRICAAFLCKFSLELMSHQSEQILFSVELG